MSIFTAEQIAAEPILAAFTNEGVAPEKLASMGWFDAAALRVLATVEPCPERTTALENILKARQVV